MKYHNTPARPGLTAIAAVLALTTTPAFAQAIMNDPLGAQAPPAAGSSAPPPAPLSAPVDTAPAPSAPDQTVDAQPAASPKLPDLPVATAKAPKRAASAQTPRAEPAPPAARRWPVTPAASTVSPVSSDAPVMAPQGDLLEPVPVAEPAQPTVDAAPAPAPQNDLWLPLAGGLLLAGSGAAFAKKRRRKSRTVASVRPADTAPRMAPVPAPAPVLAPVAAAPREAVGDMALLEALVAQPPSPENPFHTRKLRLRRAHHLLRTGQVPTALPEAPAADVPAARSAADRWSEMRVAGQSPVQLSWRPVRG